MKSNKATLFYIISKSDLVYSQKNKLSLLVDDLSEEKAEKLRETVKQVSSSEKVFCVAKFFGIDELKLEDEKMEDGK